MKELLQLLAKGIFTVRIVTFALTAICCCQWLAGVNLDETLKTSWLMIMGFWFSSEITNGRRKK